MVVSREGFDDSNIRAIVFDDGAGFGLVGVEVWRVPQDKSGFSRPPGPVALVLSVKNELSPRNIIARPALVVFKEGSITTLDEVGAWAVGFGSGHDVGIFKGRSDPDVHKFTGGSESSESKQSKHGLVLWVAQVIANVVMGAQGIGFGRPMKILKVRA